MRPAATDGWELGHRPGLDQLRGLAVLLVMWGHASPFFQGGSGVVAFFVLSGFLITRLMIEEHQRSGRIDIRAFYLRRARRLLPALPFALGLMALATAMEGLPILLPLLSSAGYVANLAAVGNDLGGFGHMWSLAVEEHFYLVWPALFLLLRPRLLPWCIGAGLAAGAARLAVVAAGGGPAAYYLTPLRLDALLFGAALAILAPRLPRISWRLTAAAAAALFATSAQIGPEAGWLSIGAVVASVLLVISALTWRRRPVLEHIGRISYGLYLFHVPVHIFMAHKVMVWGSNQVAYAIILFLITLPLAQGSWMLIERRFVRRRDAAGITPPGRRSPTPSGPTVAASPAAPSGSCRVAGRAAAAPRTAA